LSILEETQKKQKKIKNLAHFKTKNLLTLKNFMSIS